MDFQGRSPLKDVTRSVVLGAAMIPAALLSGCRHHGRAVNETGTNDPPTTDQPTMVAGDAGAGVALVAPPPDVVRPRSLPEAGVAMPTRGFAGRAPRR